MSKIRHHPQAPTLTARHDAGAVIDRHRHDNHQLIYASTGVIAVHTAAGDWVAACDRAVWLPAGVWHEHRFYGVSAMHSIAFPRHNSPLPAEAAGLVPVGPLLRELIVAGTEAGLPTREAGRLRAVLRDQLRHTRTLPITLPAATDARLARACAVAGEDLAHPLPLRTLAAAVGSSERTLARLFRAEFGMTYPRWRTNLRVYRAMIELAGGASVTETAHRCGWATPSAFIDTFRRTVGRTPGAYRSTAVHINRDLRVAH
jgi:AraC-like DNA-binding protein